MKNIKKIFYLLTIQERKRAILLLIMSLVMALLDTIGVASILPFMAVLTNQTLIETNSILNTMFLISGKFGIENNLDFLFLLGGLVFVLLIASLLFKALTTYASLRFAQMRQHSIGKRLLEGYLHQPYSWFLNRHSADLGKTILSEVGRVVGGGVNPLIELIAKGLVTIALLTLLILADPKLAILISFSLGGAYGLIFLILRKFIKKIGKESVKSNESRFIAISEAFGAAKEVKFGGLENVFIKRFSETSLIFAKNQATSHIISQLPRFFLEAIAFGGVMLLILYLVGATGSLNNALPVLSLYVFAGYRLIPSLQQLYSSITLLSFVGPSVEKLYDDLLNLKSQEINKDNNIINFNKSITLKKISYQYPGTSKSVLKDISMNIRAKSTVGLIGLTGSGKTTIVDIILGLIEAQKGTLEVDGKIIQNKNIRAWQRSLGYVPQNIYLSDDSVAANIAFGVEKENINHENVEKASRISNLHNFVFEELPNKYQTKIGERGVRLSGGQKQRIAIARALYHNPKVLILDEATSALDNQTEKAVMDAVNNLSKDITIILIAHRLNTVKNCDIIFKIEKGQVVSQGTYNELIGSEN